MLEVIQLWQRYSDRSAIWFQVRPWSVIAIALVIAGVYLLQFWPVVFGLVTVLLATVFLTPVFFAKYQHISAFYSSEDAGIPFASGSVLFKTAGSVCAYYMLGWGLACPIRHNAALIVSSYLYVLVAIGGLLWAKRSTGQSLDQILRRALFKQGLLIGVLYSGALMLFQDVSLWSSFMYMFDRDLCGIYLSFQSAMDSLTNIFPSPFDLISKVLLNINIAFGFIFVLYAYVILRVLELLQLPAGTSECADDAARRSESDFGL